ncbi:alpha-ketoglutarate-dependent dioxygenase AlkB family protein [Winogradskyella sp. A3E31]|uniref:alpha-ketoglutarate-dependent dioxygenase AlkB family protein n=1 Tax=Winogradskyella sp. A3E31 TaxID=3349637 RepID=UPI00398AA11A
MELFSAEKQVMCLPNAELIYYPNFYKKGEADRLYESLKQSTKWQQDDITVYGKTYKQPRLTALFGKNGKTYSYSGILMHPKPFTKKLIKIEADISNTCGQNFDTVLLNWYRDGNDSNGWHADNEKELGNNPIIASLSFGEERPFHFKHRTIKSERHKLVLKHGSLLVMKGEMQHHWLHQIAKTKKDIGGRINLTFRNLQTL